MNYKVMDCVFSIIIYSIYKQTSEPSISAPPVAFGKMTKPYTEIQGDGKTAIREINNLNYLND